MTDTPSLIVDLTVDFSLEIFNYTEQPEGLRKFNMTNQLFKSGTSISANVNEAQSCESRAWHFVILPH